ncbi:hypothetical protein PAXINDRAFT_101328 [Paxillus involutus ATCC 200175]|uniref:Uncharacterized protein n=1 Tax=Paxillus involutus ATCC 200175 TaxID=664439 RepID=A0A0C9TNX8_PAXIN|nr:hypothetical protein PAXINDRAFT_101328 [Paxillus involutus ATCC 200175]
MEREAKTKMVQPIMSSLFTQHPSTMFIDLALERSNGENTSGGVFSVGEHDLRFANVSGTPCNTPAVIPLDARHEQHVRQWKGKSYPQSDVEGTQRGQAITLIDSLAYIPSDAVDGIYSVIEGAVHVNTKDQDSWYVRCISQANLSFIFGSDIHPVNLMELTTPVTITDDGKQYSLS